MRGERAYWRSRGKFYARAVFPPGEGSAWVLLSTGENLYWYTFSGGDSIPGGFSGGKFYAGGNSMLQHRDIVEDALQTYCKRWSKKEGVGVHALNDWKNEFLRVIDIRIDNFTKHPHLYKQPPSRSVKSLKKKMEKLHRIYVFAPADKSANNVIII